MAARNGHNRRAHVGIDIGGTFTDIGLWLCDGTPHIGKVSSSAQDPGIAVTQGLAALPHDAGVRQRSRSALYINVLPPQVQHFRKRAAPSAAVPGAGQPSRPTTTMAV